MAILEGGHIVPPRTQATSRSPAPLELTTKGTSDWTKTFVYILTYAIWGGGNQHNLEHEVLKIM